MDENQARKDRIDEISKTLEEREGALHAAQEKFEQTLGMYQTVSSDLDQTMVPTVGLIFCTLASLRSFIG